MQHIFQLLLVRLIKSEIVIWFSLSNNAQRHTYNCILAANNSNIFIPVFLHLVYANMRQRFYYVA